MSGIILETGQTNDYWNTGSVIFFSIITTHHFIIWSETRNHTWQTFWLYVYTFYRFLLTIQWNNNLVSSEYYKSQTSVLLQSPLTYLVVLLLTFVIVMPRFIWKTLDALVFHPEFTKIKGF
jgi:hypothetical protein